MSDPRQIIDRATDDQLAAIARGQPIANTQANLALIESMAVEIIQTRRRNRADSRSAEQIKKLRWAAENTLGKIEALAAADIELAGARDRADSAEDATAAAERRVRNAADELRKVRDELEARGGTLFPSIVKDLELLITRLEAP